MTSKELFLKKKELCGQLLAVVKTDWFADVLVHVKAEMMSSCTQAELVGAIKFEEVLLHLADEQIDDSTLYSGVKGLIREFKKPQVANENPT